jgi:hypothetical protein
MEKGGFDRPENQKKEYDIPELERDLFNSLFESATVIPRDHLEQIIQKELKGLSDRELHFYRLFEKMTESSQQLFIKLLQEKRIISQTIKKSEHLKEKITLTEEKAPENISERKQEIDKRIVVTMTDGGFTSLDTINSKNKGAGSTYDVRPVNDSSSRHFYHNYEEVSKRWNKDKKPFTFIYNRDGKKYLYATAGLNAYSGKSNGGRDGNVFASIELTEDLSSWVEEYILKKAIDLANKRFGKYFQAPIEFKEEYLSNLIAPPINE